MGFITSHGSTLHDSTHRFSACYRLMCRMEGITATEEERIHQVDIVSHNIMQALKIDERRCYRLAQETLLDFNRYLRH